MTSFASNEMPVLYGPQAQPESQHQQFGKRLQSGMTQSRLASKLPQANPTGGLGGPGPAQGPMTSGLGSRSNPYGWGTGNASTGVQTQGGMPTEGGNNTQWFKPTPGVPGTNPGVPGAQMTQINPDADLRSQQITPGYDPRLATAGNQSDTAAGRVAAFSGFTPFSEVSAANDPYVSKADNYSNQAASALGTGVVAPTNISGAQSRLAQAASYLPQAGGGASGVSYGADTTGVRSKLASQLEGLTGGPNRTDLASKAYELMREQQAPGREQSFRQVGQRAAALGRLGAGMTTNDLTGLEGTYAREDDQAKRGLALDAAGQELSDRLNVTGALQGGFGALSGEDRAAAGLAQNAAQINQAGGMNAANLARGLAGDELDLARTPRMEGESDRSYGLQRFGAFSDLGENTFNRGANLRGEARGEQDRRLGYEQAGLTANRGVMGDLAGNEDRIAGYGLTGRNELRGERDFQTGRADKAQDDRVQQTLLEDQLLGSEFGRNTDLARLYSGLGYQNDPTGQMGVAGGNYQDQADDAFGGSGALLEQILAGQAGRGPTAPTFPGYEPGLPGISDTFGQAPTDWRNVPQKPQTLAKLPYGGFQR